MPAPAERFGIGDWIVVPAERRLLRTGCRRRLEPRTMALLCALAAGGGTVSSADALLTACWPGQDLGDNAVHKHVALLRAALGDNAHHPRYIDTVHRRGYRLLVPVVPFAEGADAVTAHADALVAGACALEDVLDGGAFGPSFEPGPVTGHGADASMLARVLRDNRRLRALCAALLRRCREPGHGGR